MTVLQAMCQAVENEEAEYVDLIGLPQRTRTMWLPSNEEIDRLNDFRLTEEEKEIYA